MTPAPIPEPLIVRIVREQKDGLLEAERDNMLELTGGWLNMESKLNGYMDSLALDLWGKQALGSKVSFDELLDNPRFQGLITQAKAELRTFLDLAERNIISNQGFYGQLAMSDSVEALTFGLSEWGKPADFRRLTQAVLDPYLGLAGDGSPIRRLLDKTAPDSFGGLARYLQDALDHKASPEELMRAMQNGLGLGFNRVLNQARSEPFRVYREMMRAQWAASGLVSRFRRITSHDSRVCAGCLMAEGEVYELNENLEEHPQGRCQLIPDFVNLPPTRWLAGEDWFRTQEEPMQRSILGPGRYQAWIDGKFSLNELITRRQDPTWGGSVTVTPLKDLIRN